MTTAISASTYNIELRDKNGNLKGYLTPWVTDVKWERNRLGGCGRCSITIKKGYRELTFDARDDIQIRVKSGSTSKLVYRGFIANITPTLKIDQDIKLDVRGYFDLLKKLVVHSAGDTLTLPAWDSYQKLLIDFDGVDGATTHTATTGQTVTFAGTAQLDTAQYKFSTASLLLDGNSDYVTIPDNDNWSFGTADFTVDCWVRFASITDAQGICEQRVDGDNYWAFIKGTNASGNKLSIAFAIGGVAKASYIMTSAWSGCAADTWYHIEVCRYGTTMKIFIDGVSQTLTETTAIGTNDVGNVASTLDIGQSAHNGVFFNGWIDEFRVSKGIARHTNNFTPRTVPYSNSLNSDVAEYIVDTFITPNSPITKGIMDIGTFTIDTLEFLTTVEDALRTVSELTGDVEYGVDEDLVFYWRTESTTINNKFFVGNNISMLERRVNWDNLVNKIYLVGGDVAGTKYKRTAQNTDSQSEYYLAEEILNNSSIVTDTVADQYLGAILTERSTPQYNIRAKIENTDVRIEDTIPLGLAVFYDANYDRDGVTDAIGDIIGEAADGGSDITIGLTADGGSNVTVGGQYSGQIDRLSYSISDTDGRFNVEIQLGDTVLETAAKIKKLEMALNSLTQY